MGNTEQWMPTASVVSVVSIVSNDSEDTFNSDSTTLQKHELSVNCAMNVKGVIKELKKDQHRIKKELMKEHKQKEKELKKEHKQAEKELVQQFKKEISQMKVELLKNKGIKSQT